MTSVQRKMTFKVDVLFCVTLYALMQVRGAVSHEEDKVLHKDKPMRWHFGFPNKVLWYT